MAVIMASLLRQGARGALALTPRAYASVGIAVRAKRRVRWSWSNRARAGWLQLPSLSTVHPGTLEPAQQDLGLLVVALAQRSCQVTLAGPGQRERARRGQRIGVVGHQDRPREASVPHGQIGRAHV